MLVWFPLEPERKPPAEPPAEVVEPAGPRLLRVQPGSLLEKKLVETRVENATLTEPFLTITGSAVASLRPGEGPVEDRWLFATVELLTTYADWRKARADVSFAEKQLALVREFDTKRVAAQEKVVERLRKLVAAGTDTPKDLAVEENNLMQFQLQGRKEVHEAETALRNAQRNETALARQLLQAGVDPALLDQYRSGVVIVMADVPESKAGLARVGQGCRARFYAFPGQEFSGKVASLSPVLSKERRTLRVLFVLDDPRGQLKPGMFADIGLGTDPRPALLVPADAVVHVGQSDYVLAAGGEPGTWRIVEVKLGEQIGQRIVVLEGLQAGDRVVGEGAILLKPAMVRAIQGSAVERSSS
jgi:multidrug efflux pump subunit AcrA (membrane-fusion protein)